MKLAPFIAPLLLALSFGCSKGPTDDPAMAKAKEIFAQRCATCHGPQGYGDGPASGTLNPKPRHFNDRTWQAKVDDAHIEKIIVYGGAAVGLSAAMPANPDLNDKPDVVAALRKRVRKLGGQ